MGTILETSRPQLNLSGMAARDKALPRLAEDVRHTTRACTGMTAAQFQLMFLDEWFAGL